MTDDPDSVDEVEYDFEKLIKEAKPMEPKTLMQAPLKEIVFRSDQDDANFSTEVHAKKNARKIMESLTDVAINSEDHKAKVVAGKYLIDEATGRNRMRVEKGSAEALTLEQVKRISLAALEATMRSNQIKQAHVIDVSGPQIEEGKSE
jgi:hypothetical protein